MTGLLNEILAIWGDWLRPSAGLPTVQWSLLLAVAAAAGHLLQRYTGLPKVVGYSLIGAVAGFGGFSGGAWPLQGIALFLLELGVSVVLFEAGGRIAVCVADRGDHAHVDAGRLGLSRGVVLLGAGAFQVGDGVAVLHDDGHRTGLRGVGLGKGTLQAVLEVGVCRLVFRLGDVTAADERLGIERADAALRLDQVVHAASSTGRRPHCVRGGGSRRGR